MDALIVIFVTGLIAMFIAMAKKPALVLGTSAAGLVTAFVLLLGQWSNPYKLFNYSGLEFDRVAILYSMLAVGLAFLLIVGGYSYLKKESEHTGEYISLLLFSLVGAMCLLSFTDLFMFFLGLEILSIPIYVMAGTRKKDLLSAEASMKYFFTGAFATGVVLFGMAWVYGSTGSFQLSEIALAINEGTADGALLSVGILLMMASFLFKVGAAPFHFWSPDVYGGSPAIVTGYMAAVVKLAGLFAFWKLFTITFGAMHGLWADALVGAIILTLVVGNLSAIHQTRFKRLLAYSSISNAGYALMTLLVQDFTSVWNLWIYLMGYGLAIVIMILIAVIMDNDDDDIMAYKGIGRRNPFIGLLMAVGLLSMAGVPPLAGFFGKYMVFATAFKEYPLLVIFAIVNSGIGIYYYLRLFIVVLSNEGSDDAKVLKPSFSQYAVLTFALVVLLVGGILCA
jgi:NADH-quinone oxidoreductase subunit N